MTTAAVAPEPVFVDTNVLILDARDVPHLPAHTWETGYRHEDGDLVRLSQERLDHTRWVEEGE
jgi:hypothetical protein